MRPTTGQILRLTTLALAGTLPLCAQTHPNLDVLTRLAEERYAEGDIQRSAQLYIEIAGYQTDPKLKAEALFTAGWLRFLADNKASAEATLTESLFLDPHHPFKASLYTPEFESVYRQALETARLRRQRQAAETLRGAEQALNAGRDDARSLFEATLELDPDNTTALLYSARLDLEQGDSSRALERFERVVTLSYRQATPEMNQLRARALTGIGSIYQRQGRSSDALETLLEATRADPRWADAWRSLAEVHLDQERYPEAADALERLHELEPDDRDATLGLAEALERSGRKGQAAAMVKASLQGHPDDGDLWLVLGGIEAEQGKLGEAAYAFERAIETDPENRSGLAVTAAIQLTRLHLHQEEPDLATDIARRAVDLDPLAAEGWQLLGRAQLQQGDVPGAIASLDRAGELDASSVETQIRLAEAYVEADQLQNAEAAYLKALALDPGSSAAATGLDAARTRLSTERAIVNGRAQPRKPIRPKQIGIELKELDYEQMQLRGALVKDIDKKSPAARAGLRKGDLILWIGSYSVLSDKDFFQYIKRNPPGERLDIEYLRDGRIHETIIQLR
ncbi:MAG: tetratricopeptide repeat protein [Acidobacteriota bacterium]